MVDAEQLLEALAVNDADTWSVYADHLQRESDPRGALMAMMIERERNPTKRLYDLQSRYLAKHAAELDIEEGEAPTLRRGVVAEVRIESPEALVAAAAAESLRFVEIATLVVADETWPAWWAALAKLRLPWRRVFVEAANTTEPLVLASLFAACPYMETLRFAFNDAGTIAWEESRAESLALLVLENAGEVSLDAAELPRLRELRLLGETSASEELLESDCWKRLERVLLTEAPDSEDESGPIVRVANDGGIDDNGSAFVIVPGTVDAALVTKLAKTIPIEELSMRMGYLWWLPQPLTVLELYGRAQTEMPYELGVALERVLEPKRPVVMVETDGARARYLVVGANPARGEGDDTQELVRRAVDIAIGRDLGSKLFEELANEIGYAEHEKLLGYRVAYELLHIVDPSKDPIVELPDEEDDYDDEDDYGEADYYDYSNDEEAVYEEPIALADDEDTDDETEPEVEVDVIARPETWLEMHDHWDDRAVDTDDEAGEVRWPDPDRKIAELELDLDKHVAEAMCLAHGVLDTCSWCNAPLCRECIVLAALPDAPSEEVCADCRLTLAQPLPPPAERERERGRLRVISDGW